MANTFSSQLHHLIESELAAGEYASADELLLEAVQLLAERNQRRRELRQEIQIGRDQLDRGEGIELESDEALKALLEQIETEADAELAAEEKSE